MHEDLLGKNEKCKHCHFLPCPVQHGGVIVAKIKETGNFQTRTCDDVK
jgi:hypothetical protein